MRIKDFSPNSKDIDALKAFYLERQTGVDSDGNPIYAYDSNQEDDSNPDITAGALKIIKKKVFDGVAYLAVRTDKIQIWWKKDSDSVPMLVAEAELMVQVWDTDQWKDRTFNFDLANLSKITTKTYFSERLQQDVTIDIQPFYRAFKVEDIPALGINNGTWGLDLYWNAGNVKFAFYADAPGWLTRLRWRARVMDSIIAWVDRSDPINPINHKGLSFSVQDFINNGGNVDHTSGADAEAGWTWHQWTFEPDGYNCPVEDERTPSERFEESAGLFVDPYLGINEDGSYIYVYCDGFVLVFDETGTYPGVVCMNMGMTYGYLDIFQVISGGPYMDFYDPNFIAEVIEDTPNKVAVRTVGIPYDTTQYLSNSGIVESIFHIYPDKYFIERKWTVNGSITNTGFSPSSILITGAAGAANNVYENSGSENDAADATNYDNANYLAILSNEFNLQFIELQEYGFDSVIHQRNEEDGVFGLAGDGTTETAGTKYYSYCLIVDFATREGSAKLYDSTDRLAIGEQYKDLKILKSGSNFGSLDLNGSDQFLYSTDADSLTYPIVVSLWIKPDDTTPSAVEVPFFIGDYNSPTGEGLFIIVETDGTVSANSLDGGVFEDAITSNSLTSGWNHIFVKFTSNVSRYVILNGDFDNDQLDTAASNPVLASFDAFGIGVAFVNSTAFNHYAGLIAHVAVWNINLTDGEIIELAAGANPKTIHPESLLAYWPLIDNSEDSVKQYDLIENNSPTYSSVDYPVVKAIDGGSRVFDASSEQHLYVAYSGTAYPITVSLWFKPTDPSPAAYQILFSIGDFSATDGDGFFIILDTSGTIIAMASQTGSIDSAVTTNTVQINEWNHILVGFESTTHRWVILNGDIINSGLNIDSSAPTLANLDRVTIAGCYENSAFYYPFDGQIAHVAIANIPGTLPPYREPKVLARGADLLSLGDQRFLHYWPLIDDDNDVIGSLNLTPINSPTWSTTDFPNVYNPDKGRFANDLNLPATNLLSGSGFAADGAWHLDVDENNEAKITLDRTRIRPSIVLHDFPFQSGSIENPTDHLLNYLKLDDYTANNTLTAEVGPDADWVNVSGDTPRNTNTTGDNLQQIGRNRNKYTQGGVAYVSLAVGSGTVHDNAFFKKGSILFRIKNLYSITADSSLLVFGIDGNDYMVLFYDGPGNDMFNWDVHWGGVLEDGVTPAFTNNYKLQKEMIFLLSWDSDKNIILMSINGTPISGAKHTATPTTSHPAVLYIGYDGAANSNTIIDEIKTFNEAILPFGAFYIGNGQGLLADIDNPHKNLSWYFDGQAAAAYGGTNLATAKNPTNTGGSFVTTSPLIGTNHWDSNGKANVLTITDSGSDIIDYHKGFIALSFNLQTAAVGGEYLIDVRDADGSDRISAVFDATGSLDITYRSNSVNETILGNIPLGVGVWNFLKIVWDDTGGIQSFINGIENGIVQAIANTWGGGDGLTWYFSEAYNNANGCDVFIQNIFMGKDYASEIWTAMGKPLHQPFINKV
jgi:hypothetical protein